MRWNPQSKAPDHSSMPWWCYDGMFVANRRRKAQGNILEAQNYGMAAQLAE
jgi:hypothetical protein